MWCPATGNATTALNLPAAVARAPRDGPNTAQAAFSSPSGLGARMVIEPPAFSTAAAADLDAPSTVSATFALISPSPSSAHAVLRAPQHAGLHQRRHVDGSGRVELAGVDRLLDAAEIDLVEGLARRCS